MALKRFSDTSERRMLLRRLFVYAALFFFLGIAQCSFFSALKPFGSTPDVVLGGLCAVIMLDNKRAAAVAAVAAGYFVDAIGAVPPSFSPLYYLIAVAILGYVADKMMPRFISYAVLMLAASVPLTIYTVIGIRISAGALPAFPVLALTVLSTCVSTAVFCLPLYFLVKLCMLPIGVKGSLTL